MVHISGSHDSAYWNISEIFLHHSKHVLIPFFHELFKLSSYKKLEMLRLCTNLEYLVYGKSWLPPPLPFEQYYYS